jgi:hypothetical protein
VVYLKRRICGEVPTNWRNETVAMSCDGLHKSGIFRIIPQRISHSADSAVNRVVEIDKRIAAPELPLYLLARNDFTRALDQEAQNLKWLLLDFDANAALP